MTSRTPPPPTPQPSGGAAGPAGAGDGATAAAAAAGSDTGVRAPGGESYQSLVEATAAVQAIREEAQLVETLHRIGTALAAELELERIVQTVTDEATRLTGAQFGAFFYNVVRDTGESYTLYAVSGVSREAFSRFPMPRNTHVFAPTFRGDGVVRSDDIRLDPRYGQNPPFHGMPAGHLPVVSYLAVPVKSHAGEVLGGLFFGHGEAGVFSERHERLVTGIAGWAALATDNARLYAATRAAQRRAEEAAGRTANLQQLTAALAESATPEEVGAIIMRSGVLAVGAYAGALALRTADGDEVELQNAAGYPSDACMTAGRRWPIGAGMPIAEATRSGVPVYVESPEAWAHRYLGGYVPSKAPKPSASQAWAAVPLTVGGAVRGALLWTYDRPRTFSADDRALMEAIAQQCAQALERARLREAERQARLDAERGRAEAVEANRAKSEFLARMSHDLRTPLNAIGGYAQLVELGVHGEITSGQREAMGRIRRAQEHLLTLINDILGFAKLEAGQVRLELRPMTLGTLLDELRILVEPQVMAKGLRFAYQPPPPSVHVRADRERLLQLLLNLVSNAVKFTDRGEIAVWCEPGGAETSVHVRDTGRGIPAPKLASIFEPFVQAGKSVEEQQGGVGLGLAISRELARLMGGGLSVVSEEGVGSTFTVTLPTAAAPAVADAAEPATAVRGT